MKAYTSGQGFDISYIFDHCCWDAFGNGIGADVGGGRRHVATPLAQRYSSLHLVVQDMAQVVEGAVSGLSSKLTSRVEFKAHAFFAEQPVQTDVYDFQWIFHNWSDKYGHADPAMSDTSFKARRQGRDPRRVPTRAWKNYRVERKGAQVYVQISILEPSNLP